MKPSVRYRKHTLRLHPPASWSEEQARAFLHFAQRYFTLLARYLGENVHLAQHPTYLEADLEAAPTTWRAVRRLHRRGEGKATS